MEGTRSAVFGRATGAQWCKSWVLGKPKMFTRPTDQSAERWGVLDKTAPDCTEIIVPALGFFLTQFPGPVHSDARCTSADEISTFTTFLPVEPRSPVNFS